MDLLIGTAQGVFVRDGTGVVTPAGGEALRNVRHLSRANGAVLAGAEDGVHRSTDGGRTWRSAGLSGRLVWDVAVSPDDPRTLYAVTEPSALFRSKDGGQSWEEIPSFRDAPGAAEWCLPGTSIRGRARTVVIDRARPEHWLVGVEVGAVYETLDGGATWRCSRPGANPDIHVLVAHPQQPGVIFTSTGFGRPPGDRQPMSERIAGMFRSDDGGASWTFMWAGIRPPYTRPLCIDPRPPHALTVASAPTAFSSQRDAGGAQAVIYQRDDERPAWRSLGDAVHSPSAVNFHAVTPDPAAAGGVLAGTENGEVWRVAPDARWTLLASGLPQVQALLPL